MAVNLEKELAAKIKEIAHLRESQRYRVWPKEKPQKAGFYIIRVTKTAPPVLAWYYPDPLTTWSTLFEPQFWAPVPEYGAEPSTPIEQPPEIQRGELAALITDAKKLLEDVSTNDEYCPTDSEATHALDLLDDFVEYITKHMTPRIWPDKKTTIRTRVRSFEPWLVFSRRTGNLIESHYSKDNAIHACNVMNTHEREHHRREVYEVAYWHQDLSPLYNYKGPSK